MTKEEINELGFEDLETRAAEIAKETEEADADKIEELNAEGLCKAVAEVM